MIDGGRSAPDEEKKQQMVELACCTYCIASRNVCMTLQMLLFLTL